MFDSSPFFFPILHIFQFEVSREILLGNFTEITDRIVQFWMELPFHYDIARFS